MALVILIKGYGLTDLTSDPRKFVWTLGGAFCNGLFVSLLFMFKYRDARAQTQMLRAEADRNLLSMQAVEAELKLMQAQVEPHFLFNTLASVQFLTETDPPMAGLMLGHLLSYLRAALPQLRSGSTTLGQEAELARAYLSIMQMRMGVAAEVHCRHSGRAASAALSADAAHVGRGKCDQAWHRATRRGRRSPHRGEAGKRER